MGGGPVDAVGDGLHRLAVQVLALGEDLVGGPLHGVGPEALVQGHQLEFTGAASGDLGMEVAPDRAGQAAVAGYVVDDLPHGLARPVHGRGAEAVALLVDLGGVHRPARLLGPDVQPVGLGGPETDQPVL